MMKNIYLILMLFTVGVVWMSCDSEPAVVPNVFSTANSVLEGNSGETTLSFTVKLSEATTVDVSVDYTTENGTATSGADYTEAGGTLTIPAGSTQGTIDITIIGDEDFEEDETFTVNLSNVGNGNLLATSIQGTILNDDVEPIDDSGYTTPDNYAGMTKVWADEFDGTALNTADWNYETGNHGWGNNELQDYKSGTSNADVANGYLTITAKNAGGTYTSARLTTQNKQSFQYGRIDIRAKLPYGQGIWPALWMLGDNFGTDGWPACGEIDIMELIGHQPNRVYGTIHWDNNGSHADFGGSTALSSGDFSDEFHVFTIIWDSQSIKWLLDDVQFHTVDTTPADLSEFRNKFFFIFNVAVGGNWPGYPDATTTFPQEMVVDYVRVFQ